jgi:hypothetical protein
LACCVRADHSTSEPLRRNIFFQFRDFPRTSETIKEFRSRRRTNARSATTSSNEELRNRMSSFGYLADQRKPHELIVCENQEWISFYLDPVQIEVVAEIEQTTVVQRTVFEFADVVQLELPQVRDGVSPL